MTQKHIRALALLPILGLLVFPLSSQAQDTEADDGQWIQLFNGKNLDGWTPKITGHAVGENFKDTFVVRDGSLTINYDQYEEFKGLYGHIFYNGEFSHYILHVEYRFIGDQCPGGPGWAFRNNGLMLHGQTPQEMNVNQDYPDSIEVQLLGGRETGRRTTANLCTPGTQVVLDGKLHKQHCTSSSSKTYRGDQWVDVTVVVRGDKLFRHYVEGELVMEYTDPQLNDGTLLERGTISVQSESHPTQFRTIEVKRIDPDTPIKEEQAALTPSTSTNQASACCGKTASAPLRR